MYKMKLGQREEGQSVVFVPLPRLSVTVLRMRSFQYNFEFQKARSGATLKSIDVVKECMRICL